MKKLLRYGLFVIAGLAIAACADDDGPGQFRYPLKAGTVWFYTQTRVRIQDSAVVVDPAVQIIVRAQEEDTLSSYGPVTALEILTSDFPDGAEIYQSSDDGLYLVATCGSAAMVTPKRSSTPSLDPVILRALEAADIIRTTHCDGQQIIGHDDTPLVLPSPIRIGQDWRYRLVEELDWDIRKVVSGWSEVRVPAGKFDAYQVDWYYVGGPKQIQLTDDICAIGLLRRTLRVDSVKITTPNYPVGDGQYETWIESLILDSLK